MGSDLDYVSHLARESARFAAAVAEAAPADPVPTCPEWDVDDLLWHLGEVQWFWATIVRQALQGPPPAEVRPERPATRAELASFFDDVSAELVSALTAAPQDRVWAWSSDHTVSFVRRRQGHEALIHRIDAELTIGSRTPMDAQLSDDGIDEVLRVMYGHAPDWATFSSSDSGLIRLQTGDTAGTWLVSPGRLTGPTPTPARPWTRPAWASPTTAERRRKPRPPARQLTWTAGSGGVRPSRRSSARATTGCSRSSRRSSGREWTDTDQDVPSGLDSGPRLRSDR